MNNIKQIHFIGIGGVSMSGLALILRNKGYIISGSDRSESDNTRKLKALGIKVSIPQVKENISKEIELVVYTAAINEDNEELNYAREIGIKCITRAKMLGEIMDMYKNTVGVSGTHGKTTTTGMISNILIKAGLDPNISIGGNLKEINGNVRIGKGDVFLTEACEYTNSFLELRPEYEIILNIEEDHLDFFKDLDDIRNSFSRYIDKCKGKVIINEKIPNIEDLAHKNINKIYTYGLNKGNYIEGRDVEYNNLGQGRFNVYIDGKYIDNINLLVRGEHNIENALASYLTSYFMGIDKQYIKEGLESFRGVERRLEYKGEYRGCKIIDDYAHHPTEIKTSLNALRNGLEGDMWTIFQPHTYSRTKFLFNDFVDALSLSDYVIIGKIYAAREKNTYNISGKDLKEALVNKGVKAYYFEEFDDIIDFVSKKISKKDLLITMGAGDIVNIGNKMIKM